MDRPPKTNKSCWAKVEGRLLYKHPGGKQPQVSQRSFFPRPKRGEAFFLRKTGGGKTGETEPLVLSLWLTFFPESLNGGKM